LLAFLCQTIVEPSLVPDQVREFFFDSLTRLGRGQVPLVSVERDSVKDDGRPGLTDIVWRNQGVVVDHRSRVHGLSEDPKFGVLLEESDTPLAVAAHRQAFPLDFLIVLDRVGHTFS